MRIERIIYSVLIIASAAAAAINWRRATLFQVDNDALRARIDALENEVNRTSKAAEAASTSTEKIRSQTSELMKLRNEVTQLRTTSKSNETLGAENQRLRAENQQLKGRATTAQAPVAAPPGGVVGVNQFPRESWSFAGYGTPEAALVSAIWAMKEGDPKTYLDSLAPQEQERTAQGWLNKSESEISEKHKSDVAAISGMRVLERQSVAPNEMVMNVYLEGPNRVEKIKLNQVGQDWKFGGFIRDAQQQQQQPATAAPPALPR